jgi:hypothetical protein
MSESSRGARPAPQPPSAAFPVLASLLHSAEQITALQSLIALDGSAPGAGLGAPREEVEEDVPARASRRSSFKGVSWRDKKWQVSATKVVNGEIKSYSGNRHVDEEAAARQADE